MTEKFTTAEILSVTTGVLHCPIEGLYKILNHLTGDNLFTHQLPQASEACEQHLLDQCPWAGEIDGSLRDAESWKTFLAETEALYGTEHTIAPLPDAVWTKGK